MGSGFHEWNENGRIIPHTEPTWYPSRSCDDAASHTPEHTEDGLNTRPYSNMMKDEGAPIASI